MHTHMQACLHARTHHAPSIRSQMFGSPKPQSGRSKQLPGGMLGQAQVGPIMLPPLEQSPSGLAGDKPVQEASPKDQYHQK